MAISPLAGIADNVLSTFVNTTVRAATTRQAFTSLFLPEQLQDPTSSLSSNELVSLLLGSRNTLLDLSSTAARLDLGNPLALFHGAAVTSSNPNAIAADVQSGISSASRPETATYSLTVSQVALAQSNVGTALSSTATSGFQTGVNTARFLQKGVTTDVSFTVGAADSNLTVLNGFAAAVNAASGLDVTAAVRTDATAGTSRLVLTSRYTGTTNGFTVSDQAATPATNAGVASATTSAQNAAYTLNGAAFTSDTNEFYLGTYANLHLDLLTTTSSAVVIAVKPDVSQLSSAIGSLADAYNGARSLFDAFQSVNPAVSSQLSSVVERLRGDLGRIGISVGSDGGLSVDSSALTTALSQHYATVVRTIGEGRGLAPDLRSVADVMLARPSAQIAPLPAFQAGYAPQLLSGAYAKRLDNLRFTGLLIDALS